MPELKPCHWISVEERLPETTYKVIVVVHLFGRNLVTVGRYKEGIWLVAGFDEFTTMDHITHWMPLPKPPGEV